MCLPESPKEGELAKQRRSFSTTSLPINKREKKLRAGREISVYLFSDKEYVAQRCIINEWPKEIKQRPGLPTPTSLPFHLLGGFQIGFPRGSLEKMVEESPVQWADSDSPILSTMFKQSFLVVSPINTHTHTHNFCTILHLKQISVPKTKFKKYCLIPYFDLSMLYVQQETRPCFKDLLPNTEGFFFPVWIWYGTDEGEWKVNSCSKIHMLQAHHSWKSV